MATAIKQDYAANERLNHNDWNAAATKVQTALTAADVAETSTRQFVTPTEKTTWNAKAAMSDVTNAVTALKASVPTQGDNLLKLYNLISTLNSIVTGTTPDGDSVTNTIQEILSIFSTYPEGANIATALAGKANTTDVVNNLTTTVSGKIADAKALKTLKDLVDGLNVAAQALTNKVIDGTLNNLLNIRASQLYAADMLEVTASNLGTSGGALSSQLKAVGAKIKNMPVGVPYFIPIANTYGVDMYYQGGQTFTAYYYEAGDQVMGLAPIMDQAGVYTPFSANFNGVSFYRLVNGVLTKVAISANIPNLWSTPAGEYFFVPFTGVYTIPASGIYYGSTQFWATADPSIKPKLRTLITGVNSAVLNSIGFSNHGFIQGVGGYANLPLSTIDLNANPSAINVMDGPDPTVMAGY